MMIIMLTQHHDMLTQQCSVSRTMFLPPESVGGDMSRYGENGGGEGLSPAKKCYSVEDITAALDDMIEDNDLLRENARTEYKEPGGGAAPLTKQPSAAGEELDALAQALKGFPPRDPNAEEG